MRCTPPGSIPRNRPGPCHGGLAGAIAVALEKTGQAHSGPTAASKGLSEMKQGLWIGCLPSGFLRPFEK